MDRFHVSEAVIPRQSVDGLEVSMFGTGSNYAIYNDSGSPRAHDTGIEIFAASTAYGVFNVNAAQPVLQDLQNLIETGSGSATAYGIRDDGGGVTSVSDTRIVVGPAQSFGYGVRVGNGSSPRLEHTSIEIEGGGTARLVDLEIDVKNHAFDYGVYASASSVEACGLGITSCDGSFDYGVYMTASAGSWTVTVGGSQLAGAAVDPRGGTMTCDEVLRVVPGLPLR